MARYQDSSSDYISRYFYVSRRDFREFWTMNTIGKAVDIVTPINQVTQYQKLMEMAISSNADVDKLEKLMDLQDRWEQKEAKKAFNQSMSRFQSQCPVIQRTKNGHNFKYAPMCDVIAQVKQLEADCGLSHRFEQDTQNESISITCVVSHVDGHSEKLRLEALADQTGSKNAVQAIGSTISYLQRYSFLGSFGIATADEDMDGRIPKPEGKPGSWKAGKDYNLLPEALRQIFIILHESFDLGDYQLSGELLATFDLHEEKIAVWKCFASDERTTMNNFFKSDEFKEPMNPEKIEYLKGAALEKFLKKFN